MLLLYLISRKFGRLVRIRMAGLCPGASVTRCATREIIWHLNRITETKDLRKIRSIMLSHD